MEIHILSPSPAKRQRLLPPVTNHVMPGDVITTEPGFMRGHGTLVEGTTLIATVSGVVEKVNKLVSVRPLKSRYQPEVGDVVVGRISGIHGAKWKVDINAKTAANLPLVSINLPSGVQRRRTQTDELHMRNFFTENDLISAEVQNIHQDGIAAVHTRSIKYRKLENGHFLAVSAGLVKRSKAHFHSLPCGVDIILGVNGYIWITEAAPPLVQTSDVDIDEEKYKPHPLQLIGPEVREKIARVSNSISALAQMYRYINADAIMTVYKRSINMEMAPKDMLKPEAILQLTVKTANIDVDDDVDMHAQEEEAVYIR